LGPLTGWNILHIDPIPAKNIPFFLKGIDGDYVFREYLYSFLNQSQFESNSNIQNLKSSLKLLYQDNNISKLKNTIINYADRYYDGRDDFIIEYKNKILPKNSTEILYDISLKSGESQQFIISSDNFDNISLKLADGSNLPSWISYSNGNIDIDSNNIDIGVYNFIFEFTFNNNIFTERFNVAIDPSFNIGNGQNYNLITGSGQINALANSIDLIQGSSNDNDVINYAQDALWSDDFVAKNSYTGQEVKIVGKSRSYDAFDGGGGVGDSIILTDSGDALFLDDIYSENPNNDSISRIAGVETIYAGGGG
jgi:hypothetical protein